MGATHVWAQQTPDIETPSSHAVDAPGVTDDHLPPTTHMFGVLPNYTSVEEGDTAWRITTKQTLQMAALGSLDPYIFPFWGGVSAINDAPGQSYAQRYMASLADNSIGNFLTTAVMPLAMGHYPRYFESGNGSVPRRLVNAAGRSLITRSCAGTAQFNVSELGGNAIAATLSKPVLHARQAHGHRHPQPLGHANAVGTLSNEMKEFWPDIRAKLHHHAALP